MLTKLAFLFYLCNYVDVLALVSKRDVAVKVPANLSIFRENCLPQSSGQGCRCTSMVNGKEEVKLFETNSDCQKPTVVNTIQNKAKLNEEFKKKFGDMRANCFPRASSGCRCAEKDDKGEEITKYYDSVAECAEQHDPNAIDAKQALNKEMKTNFGNLKENCYPRPGKGCRCVEKQEDGSEQTKLYDSEDQCKVKTRSKRDHSRSSSPVSQNVRDPVREKAAQNYQAVLNELKDKFRGLKEGCYPRPKGCLCVVGKDEDGRDRTERRMKDSDCKCQPGEAGHGCPAAGA